MRLGPGKVAYAASAVLLLNYMGAIATALFSGPGVFRSYLMILGHGMAAAWLVFSTSRLKPNEDSSLRTYYKQIWNLFYAEYAMYPFI